MNVIPYSIWLFDWPVMYIISIYHMELTGIKGVPHWHSTHSVDVAATLGLGWVLYNTAVLNNSTAGGRPRFLLQLVAAR